MFAQLYNCPEHGEIWHTQTVEEIDTENDEVYEFEVCSQCGKDVKPILYNGKPTYHALTEEEMYFEQFSPFDEEEEYEFDD